MGCTTSKKAAEAPPTIEVRPPADDVVKSAAPADGNGAQPASSKEEPATAHRSDQVKFDSGSHPEINYTEPGKVYSRSALSWKESCWSAEEVSSGSKRGGVSFQCGQCFLMAGLKAAPGQADDSWAALDFGFYCMEHGRVQIFERGELKYTHKPKYTADSVFQLRNVDKAIEYLIDDKVVYTSQSTPASSLHFQATFSGHPCDIFNLLYV